MNDTVSAASQHEFGRRVAARLDQATAELPHEVTERLRAARVQALARRKVFSLQPARTGSVAPGGVATLGGDGGPPLWHRIASILPLIALLAGLVAIESIQDDQRARDVADVDAALLTDDLPPDAYADPGFLQFLKSGR